MRKTKKAALNIAPIITGLLFLIIVVGGAAVLIWPNLSLNETTETQTDTTSDETNNPDTAEIVFESVANSPYDWFYEVEDEEVASVSERLTINEQAYLEDSKLTIKYYIKGKNTGKTKITFMLRDKSGEDLTAVETRTYNLIVDTALNVTAEEIKAN